MRTLTPERRAILSLMVDGRSYRPSDIAIELGKRPDSIATIMQKMVATGHLTQPAYGRYVVVKR